MENTTFTVLFNQTGRDQPGNMVRECGSGNIEHTLDIANRTSTISTSHQMTKDRKSGRMAQFSQSFCSQFNLHGAEDIATPYRFQ